MIEEAQERLNELLDEFIAEFEDFIDIDIETMYEDDLESEFIIKTVTISSLKV